MKRFAVLAACVAMLFGCALAEQEAVLPGGRYVIDVPDEMEYSDAVDGEAGMDAYVSRDLEIDLISYRKEDAALLGMAETLKETAKLRKEAGADVEIRKVNGIEMLCFRTEDETDGALCVGYLFEDGDLLIEIDFWYGSQEAAELTKEIISSIREAE